MAISAGSTISASDIKFGTMVKTFAHFKESGTFGYRSYADVPWAEFGCSASKKTCVLFTPGVPFGSSSRNYCMTGSMMYGYDDSTATNCRIYITTSVDYVNAPVRFSYFIIN